MLTAGDALAKTLAKSQKITFWSKKNSFRCFFFLLTAGDALMKEKIAFLEFPNCYIISFG